jgi:hypothetical protein
LTEGVRDIFQLVGTALGDRDGRLKQRQAGTGSVLGKDHLSRLGF